MSFKSSNRKHLQLVRIWQGQSAATEDNKLLLYVLCETGSTTVQAERALAAVSSKQTTVLQEQDNISSLKKKSKEQH